MMEIKRKRKSHSDLPMGDLMVVDVFDRLQQLPHHRTRFSLGISLLLRDALEQFSATDQLHHEIEAMDVLVAVDGLDDIAVVEAFQDVDFSQNTVLGPLRHLPQIVDLDRDLVLRLATDAFLHQSIGAFAQHVIDVILGQELGGYLL